RADTPEVVLQQHEEAFALASMEPHDSGEVFHLLGREIVNLARYLSVNIARVEHQHLVAALSGLGAVEEPQLTWHGARVEEIGADGDHYVYIPGLQNLFAHLLLAVPCARCLRGHDKARATGLVQVAPEVGDPEVVAVRDLLLLIDTGQPEGQTRIALDSFGVDQVYVEWR